MRPREIQARIRAGASVAQVATSADTGAGRVLRFAYPVLLERSTTAAQARLAHPMRRARPGRTSRNWSRHPRRSRPGRQRGVGRLRREDGRWAVRLSWRHGDSAHAAHWSLDLGRRALQPEDPAAEQLSAEEFHARTITAVTPLAVAARAAAEPTAPREADRRPPERPGGPRPEARQRGAARRAGGVRARHRGAPGRGRTAAERRQRAERRGAATRPASDRGTGERGRADRAQRGDAEGRRPREARDAEEDADPAAESRIAAGGGTVPLVDVPGDEDRARRATVPSWDDILLGVRRRH